MLAAARRSICDMSEHLSERLSEDPSEHPSEPGAGMDPAERPARMPRTGTERELLQGWLDTHRQTLRWKASNLGLDQLLQPSVAPSGLTLLGLVRHMAECERGWFQVVAAGRALPDLYPSPDGDLLGANREHAEADLLTYEAAVAAADEVLASVDLDEVVRMPATGERVAVRWIWLHMIEEYARHNGHADLLRERIDGATGD